MNRIAKQFIAALVSTFLALGLSIGFAGATDQPGDSNQTNGQVLPINVNAPISVLSHGSNDDVSQSNEASPTNYRSDEAGTFQVIDQSQTVESLT